MMKRIIQVRDKVLKSLAGKLGGFYLAGGTALSLFYFKHRESYDLDFFTGDFSRVTIEQAMHNLSKSLAFKIKLIGEQNRQGFAKMVVFELKIDKESSLKIDFVEDVYKLIEPLKVIDAIPILSVQDIYLRKIFTACGSIASIDSTGRKTFIGGRQEAKDFFDLYFLSNTFMPLSDFAVRYCTQSQIESIIIWYRTYDRLEIKTGLTEIMTDKKISYIDMESHFKKEIEKIAESEL